MVYRSKRRYVRRVRRGRVYKRRIHRPIKGSGYQGKRLFKLREHFELTFVPNLEKQYTVYDQPNNAQDWSNFAALFDTYRCCAAKLKFIPIATVNELQEVVTATATGFNVPMYIITDYNTVVSSVLSQNEVIRYENLKIRSLTKMWTHYTKFRKNTVIYDPGNVQYGMIRGYQPTNIPKQSQTIVVWVPKMGTATAAITIGTLIVTCYVIGRESK